MSVSVAGRRRPEADLARLRPHPRRRRGDPRGSRARRRRRSGSRRPGGSSSRRTAMPSARNTCARRRSKRSRVSWVGSSWRTIGSPGLRRRFAAAVASRAKHSTGVPGLFVSGLSRPMIRMFSSTPSRSAWIVSPSTTRMTDAADPGGSSDAAGVAGALVGRRDGDADRDRPADGASVRSPSPTWPLDDGVEPAAQRPRRRATTTRTAPTRSPTTGAIRRGEDADPRRAAGSGASQSSSTVLDVSPSHPGPAGGAFGSGSQSSLT